MTHMTHRTTGNLTEVFSGIQGEGIYVGRRQIFIRLCGCNLDCDYCDTEDSRSVVPVCRLERTPGRRDFAQMPNPVSLDRVIECVRGLNSPIGLHHSAVLTGGEPLLDLEWAVEIARSIKESGMQVMLETNGSLPDRLDPILPVIDIISMDIKLTSAGGGESLFNEHRRFILKAEGKELYVKIVVCSSTQAEEIDAAARIVGEIDRRIPVMLQPVTERRGVRPPAPDQVLEWQSICAEHVDDVRVIPQCHKILGQL